MQGTERKKGYFRPTWVYKLNFDLLKLQGFPKGLANPTNQSRFEISYYDEQSRQPGQYHCKL